MTNKSYQDLIVWQKAMDLVEDIYKITQMFPKKKSMASRLRFVDQRFPFHPI